MHWRKMNSLKGAMPICFVFVIRFYQFCLQFWYYVSIRVQRMLRHAMMLAMFPLHCHLGRVVGFIVAKQDTLVTTRGIRLATTQFPVELNQSVPLIVRHPHYAAIRCTYVADVQFTVPQRKSATNTRNMMRHPRTAKHVDHTEDKQHVQTYFDNSGNIQRLLGTSCSTSI
jgi:hypothetical protein